MKSIVNNFIVKNVVVALFFLVSLFCYTISLAQVSYASESSYGLRKLNPTYSGSAIQIRRACDNATLNIGFNTCGQLDTTAMKNFVFQSTPPLSALISVSAAAFSLRKLVCGYEGYAIQVRRSSDNATQNIGFTASGELDTVSLKTFIGINNGFISKWYDQSGNVNDASQTTITNQPELVVAGVINRRNGLPAAIFTTSLASYLIIPYSSSIDVSTASTTNVVFTKTGAPTIDATIFTQASPGHILLSLSWNNGGGTGVPLSIGYYPQTIAAWQFAALPTDVITGSNNIITGTILSGAGNTSSLNLYENGSLMSSVSNKATLPSPATQGYYIGKRWDVANYAPMDLQELIVFKKVLSTTDRQFLEWNQSQYYNIIGPAVTALPNGYDNAYISVWYDQSGNGKDALQTAKTNQPKIMNAGVFYKQSNLPAVYFANQSSSYLTSGLTGVQATTSGNIATVNGVFQSNNVSNSLISNGGGPAYANRFNIHAGWVNGITYFDIGNYNIGGRLSGGLTWTSHSIGTFMRNGAIGNIWKNGLAALTSTALSTAVTSANNLTIGGNPTYPVYMTGYISELSIFSSALNTTRRTLLETNESAFYNLAISNSKYTPPTSSSYNLYVNGIGYTSPTDSIAGTRITAGMGFNSQGVTLTDYLRDAGDYLTAGMNCPLSTISSANLPPTVMLRWANDWFINKTDVGNNDGLTTIFFDFSDYGIPLSVIPGIASNYVLLYRNSSIGTFSIVPTTTVTAAGDRVYFLVNTTYIPSNYYYTIGTSNLTDSPLPIELLNFNATINNDIVYITWITATELNNDYFTIEKSKDGISFENLSIIDGAGNSTSFIHYSDIDYKPYNGISYYRLKQTDFDGAFSYSDLVAVNCSLSKDTGITVFPNPTDGNMDLSITGLCDPEIFVTIKDAIGKEIFSEPLINKNNECTYIINSKNKLTKGIYLVTVSVKNKDYSQKLIVN